jgi:dipeptidyl aminopeptidase/acylaminoacyl peptidase
LSPSPAYSPDGRYIAYRAQTRPGNEADRWRLMKFDREAGTHAEIVTAFDRSVNHIEWSPDSQTIYFNAEDRGFVPVFRVIAAGGVPAAVTPSTFAGEFALSPDGRTLVVARSSQQSPPELAAVPAAGGDLRPLTSHNADRLAQLDLPEAEHFTFAGAAATEIHGMLLRPPAFDPSKKYPVLMVLHGGPETQFGDTWSVRWNTQVLASPGYAVLMINRRGSTGFGQQFTDEINKDWGGKAFEDVMKGLDAALAKYAFLDGTRVAAAGASYGGYMIAWMASQAKGRFKALVCHAGVYNLVSMYGATEEVWFPEWSFGGTPWADTEDFLAQSPHTRAADFGTFKTPTLVIHGELDFRVPYTQGLELYTALQRQGVPSRLIVFPDEGHWILKPQNSAFWYHEVLQWLQKYL